MPARTVLFIGILAGLWVFLGSTLQWVSAFTGVFMGLLLFRFLRGGILKSTFSNPPFPFRNSPDLIIALVRYAWVVAVANVEVAILIVSFRKPLNPAILRLHSGEMGDLEQTILANSITLTPGTITMSFSPDRQYLYIHVLDVEDLEVAREQLRMHLEVHFGRGLKWWKSPSI
ncbi:hypothetical protein FIM12_01885 [SAR202 cluster bacterium AD-804-J14_MRT_500m]|nr:hypothetical protein [SAR202 cluster bacterium AD-804-J14_MRT_500m]